MFYQLHNRCLKNICRGVLMFAAFCIGGCSQTAQPPEDVSGRPPETADVSRPKTLIVQSVTINDGIEAVGIVQAVQEVEVSGEISGKITNIHCAVGDAVAKGDLLLELDDEMRSIVLVKKRALLQKAKANFATEERDADKAGALFEQKIISDSEYDGSNLNLISAEADLRLAEADLAEARKNLRDTKICAPFSGLIAAKAVEVGRIIASGQTLFLLVDNSRVKLTGHFSEFDVTRIAPGAPAKMVIDSLREEYFSGTVGTIAPSADGEAHMFPVEVIVDNPDGRLLPGMVGRIEIRPAAPREVVTVPVNAVSTIGGQTYVTLLRNGRREQQRIVTGDLINDATVIEKGLKAGDEIVLEGF